MCTTLKAQVSSDRRARFVFFITNDEKAVKHPVYLNNFRASPEFFDDFSLSTKKIWIFRTFDLRCFRLRYFGFSVFWVRKNVRGVFWLLVIWHSVLWISVFWVSRLWILVFWIRYFGQLPFSAITSQNFISNVKVPCCPFSFFSFWNQQKSKISF